MLKQLCVRGGPDRQRNVNLKKKEEEKKDDKQQKKK